MPNDDPIQQMLRSTGLDSVRFASGVVGNSTYVVCACAVAAAVAAWALSPYPWLAVVAMLSLVGLAIFYMQGTWRFADRHPDLALLGGAQLLKLRQMEMGAKEIPMPQTVENVQAPVLGESEET